MGVVGCKKGPKTRPRNPARAFTVTVMRLFRGGIVRVYDVVLRRRAAVHRKALAPLFRLV